MPRVSGVSIRGAGLLHHGLFGLGDGEDGEEDQLQILGVGPDAVVHPAGGDRQLVLRLLLLVDVDAGILHPGKGDSVFGHVILHVGELAEYIGGDTHPPVVDQIPDILAVEFEPGFGREEFIVIRSGHSVAHLVLLYTAGEVVVERKGASAHQGVFHHFALEQQVPAGVFNKIARF